MLDVVDKFKSTLLDFFSGTTVGDGGDFSGSGSLSLSGTGHGPFAIQVNVNQWELFNGKKEVTYPSINIEVIQSEPIGRDRLNDTGGLQRLWLNFRASVDQQVHGESIVGVLEQSLRTYFANTRFSPSGSNREVYHESTTTTPLPEGQLLHYDLLTLWKYHSD